jgi:hypothetical protein
MRLTRGLSPRAVRARLAKAMRLYSRLSGIALDACAYDDHR